MSTQHRIGLHLMAAAAIGSAVLAASPALPSAAQTTPAALKGGSSGMRGARYCEILVVTRHLAKVQAKVYNTRGLNDCPDAAWANVNADALKKQLKAVAIVKNGPRYFMMDTTSYSVPGEVESFDGLRARLLATVPLSLRSIMGGSVKQTPYVEQPVSRTTTFTFLTGRPAYELIAPNGKTYVMQSYALIVDPHQTQASLASLGKRLKLPAGWKFRVVIPRTNIALVANGTAYVVQDDLQNTYQRLKG